MPLKLFFNPSYYNTPLNLPLVRGDFIYFRDTLHLDPTFNSLALVPKLLFGNAFVVETPFHPDNSWIKRFSK